jgi:nitrogenase subunit NifH
MATKTQNTVHFTLQGKGGVGKTFISVLLAQYLQSIGQDVKCVDTDPVNQTLSNYKALNAQYLKLTEKDSSAISSRNFDTLMERLLNESGSFIVDNGAASFIPFSNYIIENDAIEMIEKTGRTVHVHTIITNDALTDTVTGFVALARQPIIKRITVWLNEFFGTIEYDGKAFNEMKAYLEHKDKVHGIIRIPRRNQETFTQDIEQMIKKRLTFAEIANNKDFTLMAKSRLNRVKADIFAQLDTIGGF